MNIIVFGASGRVGTCLVEQAIAAGHDVTAFVRDPGRLKASGRLTIATGNVLDTAAVRSALKQGFDAAFSAIGAGELKASTIVTDSARGIVAAMKQSGLSRYLGVSGTAEMPRQTFFGRLSTSLMRMTPVGHAVRDHDGAFREISRSGLRWVLAGCPYIKDGLSRGNYRTSLTYHGGFKIIHPPDVADFLLRELVEPRFTGNVVGIWY